MKTLAKLSAFLVGSLMLLAAISPALALPSLLTAPEMSIANINGSPTLSTITNSHWSGYVVTGPTDSVTSASGSWKVPTTTSPEPSSSTTYYAAFWAGIDGYSDSTVEQIGIMAESTGATTTYLAWFEFYPGPAYELVTTVKGVTVPAPVKAGDVISASVTYGPSGPSAFGSPSNAFGSPTNALISPSNLLISPGSPLINPSNAFTNPGRARPPTSEFTVSIDEKTRGWSYSTSESVPNAQRSSAEWIVEAPATISDNVITILPLADFHTVYYGYDNTGVSGTCYATVGGVSGSIGSFPSANIVQIIMIDGPATATPSALSSDGKSFSELWT
ncbi:MAG: G1 family glutamic endopeptidase [Candidatus Bathyarchaeia archaeon]